MARPAKKGLDFFPLDVSIDDNLELLEAECGLEGFAIVIKLWQKIYANSYYIKWEEDNSLLFARRINSEQTKVNSVINVCFKRNLFSKPMWEQQKILTSKGIQTRYLKICSDAKRKDFNIEDDYNLVNSELTIVNTEETLIIPEESTQSKVKESKEDNKEDFVRVRKEFSGTKTLSIAEKKLPKLIKKYSAEQMIRCCQRYKEFVEAKRNNDQPNLSYVNEGTFWNGRYMDFLDENYEKPKKKHETEYIGRKGMEVIGLR